MVNRLINFYVCHQIFCINFDSNLIINTVLKSPKALCFKCETFPTCFYNKYEFTLKSKTNLTQRCVHELHDQINVRELLKAAFGRENVEEADYVFVIHRPHQQQFPVSALCVGGVLEGPAQLLYGHLSL